MLAPIIFSAITFFAILLLCMIAFYFWQRKEDLKYQSQRLEQAVNIKSTGYSEETAEGSPTESLDPATLRRDTRVSNIPWLNELLSKFLKGRDKDLMILIEQSGLKIKVGEFLLFTVIVGFIGHIVINMTVHIPIVGFALVILPFWLLNILKENRVKAFVNQMPQALDLLSSDLRAGLDIQSGLKHLSEEFSAPLGEEFGKVVVEINLGLSLSDALNHLCNRVNTMDVQILCTGIIINRELGGNLSELITSIGETIRERFRLQGMIKALTAENQMSALLLIALPIVLYIVLNLLSPAIYSTFNTDPIGQKILAGCIVSMIIGYSMMQKITKIEV